jgi:ribulose-phosphate 3-epimerase
MSAIYFSPSLMCANLLSLERDLAVLDSHNFEYIHLDIMDGHFVPNITFGFDVVNQIGDLTKTPKDLHLMMQQPELAVESLKLRPQDLVTFHIECKSSPWSVIHEIKMRGVKVGLAVNPDTPLDKVRPFLGKVDHVLVMTVWPGFAGQAFVATSEGKVRGLVEYATSSYQDLIIGIDGAVGFEEIERFSKIGVRHFVLGTSALFKGDLHEQAGEVRELKTKLTVMSLV